jgi:hypothetical protein
MTSETMATKGPAGPARTRQFCVNLAMVMHAIAQPLTILSLSFNQSLARKMKTDELHSLVLDSTKEVERLCTLFGYMQGFIIAESTEPNFSEQDVGLMLGHVAEGLALFFQEASLYLRVEIPDVNKIVLVDQMRMYQALSRILLVAHGLSIPKDTIELVGSSTSHGVRVTIRNMNAFNALDKDAALKMALAGVNIERQGGQLTWTAEPFDALIEFQAVSSPRWDVNHRVASISEDRSMAQRNT